MTDFEDKKQSDSGSNGSETGELGKKIRKARSERPGIAAATAMRQREMTGVGRAFRMASEFVAAIIVATAIGYALDTIFGTQPIFIIVLMLMGFAAGILNVSRAVAEMNAAAPKPNPDKMVPAGDDDDDY